MEARPPKMEKAEGEEVGGGSEEGLEDEGLEEVNQSS
jgi:hypothetical protein